MSQFIEPSLAIPADTAPKVGLAQPAALLTEVAASASQRRYVFLDALRGIACLLVVAYHFFNEPSFHATLARIFPRFLTYVVLHGWVGVQVFFVLSGFVIAYSLKNAYITARYIGNFIVRRSLRLDPPYWLALGLAVGFAVLGNRVDHARSVPIPHVKDILANMFYVHKILDWLALKGWANTPITNIIPPSWTLCFEVQFYLTLTVMVAIAQRVPMKDRPWMGWKSMNFAIVFLPLAMLSLYLGAIEVIVPKRVPFFPVYWYMFFLGVLIWWVMDGRVSGAWFWAYAAGAVAGFIWRHNPEMGVVTAAAILIYVVARAGHLGDWLNWRWLQFFGTISYSLYLVHVPVGERFLRLGTRLGHSPVVALGCIAMAFALSVAMACIFYRFVERPGVNIGKRLKASKAHVANVLVSGNH